MTSRAVASRTSTFGMMIWSSLRRLRMGESGVASGVAATKDKERSAHRLSRGRRAIMGGRRIATPISRREDGRLADKQKKEESNGGMRLPGFWIALRGAGFCY